MQCYLFERSKIRTKKDRTLCRKINCYYLGQLCPESLEVNPLFHEITLEEHFVLAYLWRCIRK